MSQPIPTTVPTQIRNGDTVKFNLTLNDYPQSEGWSAAITLTKAGGITQLGSSIPVGTLYSFVLSKSDTTALTVGVYTSSVFVTRSSPAETVVLEEGTLDVLPNLKSTTGLPTVPANYDARSHARIALEAIEAYIEGNISDSIQNYTIGGRSFAMIPYRELLDIRERYRAEVAAETASQTGRQNVRKIRVHFT